LGLADAELTLHVYKSHDESLGPAHDVVNNDGRVQVVVDDQAEGTSKILPCPVQVVDEGYEGGWAVDWPKWHNIICPLRSVWAGKGQLFLRTLSHVNLMIALWCVPHPVPEGHAEGKVDCGVATGDDVCVYSCDLIERDVIDAKSPYKVINIGDMFLMRFWGKESLELPLAVMDLVNVTKHFKGGDAFAHDWNFPWTIMYLLDRNGSCCTRINDTAVVLDRDELAFVVKDRPVFLNEAVDCRLERWVKMGKVQLLAEFCAVEGLIVDRMEFGVDFADTWGRVFLLAKDVPAIDAMKDGVKLMRLVRETTIVMENVLGPLATCGL
jgi:hypothetical protein